MNEWIIVTVACVGFVAVIAVILLLARAAKKHEPPSADCEPSHCAKCQGLHSCAAGKMITREQESKRKKDQMSRNSE